MASFPKDSSIFFPPQGVRNGSLMNRMNGQLWTHPLGPTHRGYLFIDSGFPKALVRALWLYKAQETTPSQGGFLWIALVWLSSLYLLILYLID